MERKMERLEQNKRRRGTKAIAAFAAMVEAVLLALSLLAIYSFFRYGILPLNYRLITSAILLAFNAILITVIAGGFKRRGLAWTGLILSLAVLSLIGFAVYYMQSGISALNVLGKAADEQVTKTQMSVRVLQQSPIQSVDQLKNVSVKAPYSSDKERVDGLNQSIQDKYGFSCQIQNTASYQSAVQELYEGKAQAIVFNESYLPLIKEQYPEFEKQTRIVQDQVVTIKEKSGVKKTQTASQAFNIYISGIDTYGPIDTTSRSDVNLVMTVNPNTKQILLTSIPRDTYLPIAGGGNDQKDKLTHAGIYGIDASIKTLENFFGIDINYFVRVNFSSVVTIVDLLNGVTVDNPVEFTSSGGHFFPAGKIQLNGEEALAFSRERYNLSGGDFDRGRNQERVLTGIIHKLSGKEILSNYFSILDLAKDSMQMNMSTNEIMQLVNLQLENGSPWQVHSTAVTGYSETGLPSYAMPGWSLYMMVPDEDSVASVKEAMETVRSGGTPKLNP